MIGIDVIYHCPICEKNYFTNLGLTHYYNYKNKIFANIICRCGANLLAKTIGADITDYGFTYYDKQVIRIIDLINNHITANGYTNKTPEEQLETEILVLLKTTFGEDYIAKYEYEAKVIIQKCISHLFNTPLDSLESYVVTEDVEKEAKWNNSTAW